MATLAAAAALAAVALAGLALAGPAAGRPLPVQGTATASGVPQPAPGPSAGPEVAATAAAGPVPAVSAAGAVAPETPDGVGPEQVVAGLSQDAVAITTSFTGSEILIYGAVKRETAIPAGPGIGVIVTVEGPSQQVTVRRKRRIGGIWINAEKLTVGAAPDFYLVASSGRLSSMLDPGEDQRYRISPRYAIRSFAGPVALPDAQAFTAALMRLRSAAGRYRLDEGKVRVVDQTLFRADVGLPSSLVEGDYKARIFLVRHGRVVDVHRTPIQVRKVGVERWLNRLAMFDPFWYGLMSLTIAMVAGWGASALFRLIRRN